VTIHIDFAAQRNCYALGWSYGEICVGCGCCGKPSPERDRARYEYWLDEWEKHVNFKYWSDDAEMRALQEKNHKLNHKYIKSRLNRYAQKVAINKLFQPDYETIALVEV